MNSEILYCYKEHGNQHLFFFFCMEIFFPPSFPCIPPLPSSFLNAWDSLSDEFIEENYWIQHMDNSSFYYFFFFFFAKIFHVTLWGPSNIHNYGVRSSSLFIQQHQLSTQSMDHPRSCWYVPQGVSQGITAGPSQLWVSEAKMWPISDFHLFSWEQGPQNSPRGPLALWREVPNVSRNTVLMCSNTQLLWDKSSQCSLFELLGVNA